ncbi:MAG: hypothetical protein N5P05_000995 [Chroococcopsis gigantea SAG 12.99]|jgi:hypothetical protein|nr:hypothetical protein [Chlorogloea purpurea SAG 13.99]MDV2999389.1 hypothetical protein [Chroococcopsis gigantea SAG 12.99]
MTPASSQRKPRRLSTSAVYVNNNEISHNISDTELSNFDCRSYQLFERLRDSLIDSHRNWFLIIEPESEDYFLDEDELSAYHRAREKYPWGKFFFFRVNETGASGRI